MSSIAVKKYGMVLYDGKMVGNESLRFGGDAVMAEALELEMEHIDKIKKRHIMTFFDGAYGIRTRGLNNANVARSQLRQCPI